MSQWHNCILLPPSAGVPSIHKGKKDKKDFTFIIKFKVTLVLIVSYTERQGEIV